MEHLAPLGYAASNLTGRIMLTRSKLTLLVLCGILGCSGQQASSTLPKPTVALAPTIYVFSKGEMPPEDLVFALREKELAVEFMEKRGQWKFYVYKNVPDELLARITPWFTRQQTAMHMEPSGEIKSNGPQALTLHTVVYGTQSHEYWSWFIADDQLKDLLAGIKNTVMKPEHLVERLPDWISDDPRVSVDFASQKKPPPNLPP